MTASSKPVCLRAPAAAPTPEQGYLNLGAYPHPTRTLAVNSRYLSLDGRPWMPVMGEFHYSRYPEAEWRAELAKMRAGGIDVVASYVIWNHHEPKRGQWRWDGQRALRRFVEIAAELGLLVYLRPGPWVHAEVRLGGFPEWLPALGPTRCNDAGYLALVAALYGQVAAQVRGLLWCDGGPVIGVQLENEYGATVSNCGPGHGAEHIAELKRLAIEAGLTVPLYTVTGWPTLDIPPREVLPVSGAYADGFWQGSREALPPSGVFLFNTRRVIGEMGNVDGTPAAGLIDTAHYPFCLAEAGGGMHQSYHRRPVVTADDVYATALVQLGSGANLYGYYMFHGGTNPVCETGLLNETQASGYPNDVPEWGYDFHAPLGQYGQVRESWGRLRCLHSFMQAFGPQLAPLEAVLPPEGPFDPADRERPRVALRAAGADAASAEGFVFVNHHVRHHSLPALSLPGIEVALPSGERLRLPTAGGLTLQPGMAFIWPLGQRLGSARLRQATVQPLTRWTTPEGGEVWVGFAVPGVAAELVFDAAGLESLDTQAGQVERLDGAWRVMLTDPASPCTLQLLDTAGHRHHLIVLPEATARQCQRVQLAGQTRLVGSSHPAYQNGETLCLQRPAHEAAWLRIFPADGLAGERDSLHWATWRWPAQPYSHTPLQPELARAALPAPALRWGPHVPWRDGPVPLAPDEHAHTKAARYRLAVPASLQAAWAEAQQQGVDARLWLRLDLVGDVARLLADDRVVDDRFCDGSPWLIGLDRWPGQRFELSLLPLPEGGLPVFVEPAARALGQGARVLRAEAWVDRVERLDPKA